MDKNYNNWKPWVCWFLIKENGPFSRVCGQKFATPDELIKHKKTEHNF